MNTQSTDELPKIGQEWRTRNTSRASRVRAVEVLGVSSTEVRMRSYATNVITKMDLASFTKRYRKVR